MIKLYLHSLENLEFLFTYIRWILINFIRNILKHLIDKLLKLATHRLYFSGMQETQTNYMETSLKINNKCCNMYTVVTNLLTKYKWTVHYTFLFHTLHSTDYKYIRKLSFIHKTK